MLIEERRLNRLRSPGKAFRQMIGTMLPPGVTVRFTGYPITEAEYARLVVRGFVLAQLVGLTLMGLTLWYTFRTLPAVVLPLLTVGIATVLVLGYMQLVGQRLTFTNTTVPLMMLVIGVAEVSFFIARYHEEVARYGWSEATTERAIARMSRLAAKLVIELRMPDGIASFHPVALS